MARRSLTPPAATAGPWALLVLFVIAAESSPALAQGRPYAALFGGAANAPVAHQVLDATITVAEAYDTNVLDQNANVNTRWPVQMGGVFTALTADGRYVLQGKRAQLAARLGTNLRYFPRFREVAAFGHYVSLDAALPVGRATTIALGEAFTYTPSYLYGLFAQPQGAPGANPPPTGANYVLNPTRSYTSATSASVVHRASRRVTVTAGSGYASTRFGGSGSGRGDLISYDAGAHVGYAMSRDVTLRVGYAFREARYPTGGRLREHDIDLGLGYTRALSRSRRTLLGFNVGSSAVEGPPPGQVAGNVRQLRASGSATLTHQIGRTWTTRAEYRRGGQFIPGLSSPVYTDGVTLTADGFVNRRADVGAMAAYTKGDFFGQSRSAFETYTAGLRARSGITRTLAAYAEYLYYFYDFGSGDQLTATLPPQVQRHGVRVGLTLWVPVLRK
jgi:hypothetical protein